MVGNNLAKQIWWDSQLNPFKLLCHSITSLKHLLGQVFGQLIVLELWNN